VKGDFSRFTFSARRHATSVLKQQGRVDLDADWNEQRAIDAHGRRIALTDVVGRAGAPMDAAGLGLVAAGADLRLSAGRYYLGGVVCENEAEVSVFAQPDLPAGMPVLHQADGTWTAVPPVPAAGIYLAYVEVWPQHRSVVEEPALREVALGGPDTATRLRTVWQVRLLFAGAPGASVTCATDPSGWAELTAASNGTLKAWSDPAGVPPTDCLIPLSAPYRGLDNQLYRVEIRAGGTPGTATYVWSRDNGAVLASWIGRDGDVLTVKNPGRDGSTGFTNGCWVQLTDDTAELRGEFGTLAQVDRAEGDRLVLKPGTATGSLDPAAFPLQPRVRRWDGFGTIPADGAEMALELGVKIAFSADLAHRYRTGDYWSFAARAAVHDVEWPKSGTVPDALTPHGPARGFGKLAVVGFDGTDWSVQRDCRTLFAPLADHRQLAYLGGDGQAVAPVVGNPAALVALPQQLAAAVTMGGRPVAGAQVRFSVTAGNGRLNAAGAAVVVATDANGEARCAWEVDSALARQEVTAALLDAGDAPQVPVLRYAATLLQAAVVSYDPAATAALAGATNVQEAIDRLATISGGGCATLTLSPGEGWVAALEGLPADQDATVCFRPGAYASPRPVLLRGLGHVRLEGGGPAAQIRVAEGEAALVFENCASVAMADLAVTVQAFPQRPVSGQLGVVTAIDCGEAAFERLRLACPADVAPRATCLTVRTGGEQRTNAATRLVRVADCDFTIGHDQTGVLVVNARRTRITGCSFRTAAKPDALAFDRLVAAPDRRMALVRRLLRSPVAGQAEAVDRGGFNTGIRVGRFAVRMNSTVPETEWRALVAALPPNPEEMASEATVQRYVARLTDAAANDPNRLPTFGRNLTALRDRLGDLSDRVFGTVEGRQTIRSMLSAGTLEVVPAVGVKPGSARAVEVSAGRATLRFDSALPQTAWNAMLAAAPAPGQDNPAVLGRHLRNLANRLLVDATFGARFAPAFLAGLKAANRAAGRCAIVIAGTVAEDVVVEGNAIAGVAEAVHVATSFRRTPDTPPDLAGSVRIRGNELALSLPLELAAAPRAVFVGNAKRVAAEDNRADAPVGGPMLVGIEMFGSFGPHLLVRDNLLPGARTGILLRPVGAVPQLHLWVIEDNITPGAGTPVVAPATARVAGNVG
jgi:hypothetical protein